MTQELVIPLSRRRLLIQIANGSLFVLGGAWSCWWGWQHESGYLHFLLPITGSVGIVFFGCMLFFILRRFFDPRPGLILNNSGMTDMSSANPAGFIPWEDIVAVYTRQCANQKFLCLRLSDQSAYLAQQTTAKRKLMEQNIKLVGAPVCLSPLLFPITLDELEKTIVSYVEASQKINQEAK